MDILKEADRLINGDRNDAYGHPLEDFSRVARLWSVALEKEISAEQAILCMILLKVSREMHKHKDDTLVDVAGYATCLQKVIEKRRETDAKKWIEHPKFGSGPALE